MAFVATKGGKKRVRAILVIRSSENTRAARKKELTNFKGGVKRIAKLFHGNVKSLTK